MVAAMDAYSVALKLSFSEVTRRFAGSSPSTPAMAAASLRPRSVQKSSQ